MTVYLHTSVALDNNLREIREVEKTRATLKKMYFADQLSESAWMHTKNAMRIKLNDLYDDRLELKAKHHRAVIEYHKRMQEEARLKGEEGQKLARAAIAKLTEEEREALKKNWHLL